MIFSWWTHWHRGGNTIAVRVGEQAGVGNIYRFMKNSLGVTSLTPEDNDSGRMILGSRNHGISPYELAGAYMMLGNGGNLSPRCTVIPACRRATAARSPRRS
ncbi:MAG: hypothetical protein V8T36_06920 [Ruthenibacterium lactatiformans]